MIRNTSQLNHPLSYREIRNALFSDDPKFVKRQTRVRQNLKPVL